MTLEIITATITDLDEVCELFTLYLAFYQRPASAEDVRAYLQERLTQGDAVIFLARREGQAVGLAQLYPSFSSLALAKSWILYDLYVSASARRQGVAEALLERCRVLAQETGACELFLQTAKDNLPAQALYEKHGYQRDTEFYNYYLTVTPPTPHHD